ncbi:hypothetical protein A3I27_04070 [Candidatus Giovannonibacteria bacterium RIFCSPLOWO2_02_FULL_43_11b]|uniref:Uncharacterized protein n=1 Tax=Candidatus Giovannonibacteria bacterium RIFCSPHIGHO2_12_FULL_43_15 TaxID=1798341 RepID=A0A1F5WQK2_9BACT|nr:MAG: hypothetical protein A2739_02645 [Candidatus Giovannonibacteria bacterium RIFCSPHIGHO2_01_FULL_43_100]OGF67106.1 MAG: hypothetical protein A3B97_04185 [Candidatus Giovannonibacteria bacterium RIFCSPHIGHO2_02_FULL_43_32]OGF77952.1 MAG: hypothetical protein A3F23_03885 [Candidatus Giovannonibacteria bacterium RIFCSPHIGHO2_12_FULL_43_15]OGF79304.1 MAG: hypothetical protein A3A15_01530 [Candidatus Giovannonibacteria bacterium RIFCSPLOWO2_01_FULL_43_60]OGF89281.1 MAG: hypothetical protein A3
MEGMEKNFFEGSKTYEPAARVQERPFEYILDSIEKYSTALPSDLRSNLAKEELRKLSGKMEMEKKVWVGAYSEDKSGSASALFEIGELFQREVLLGNQRKKEIEAGWHGSREKGPIINAIGAEAIYAKKELAAWQQKLSIFIFGNQGSPEFEEKMERYWSSLELIEGKIFHTNELVRGIRVGIGRLVTAATVFNQLGYHCETAGGEHDVSDSLDFVATKKTGDAQITLLLQVKGSEDSDDFEPALDMYYPLPQYSEEIPKSMFNLIRWTKENTPKIKEKNPNCYAIPIFLKVPSYEDNSDEITSSGLPRQSFIDKLPSLFLNGVKEAEQVPSAEVGAVKPRKKLRVVEFKKEVRKS